MFYCIHFHTFLATNFVGDRYKNTAIPMSKEDLTERDSHLSSKTAPRWTFNLAPAEMSENVAPILPFGCILNPLGELSALNVVPYSPISCRYCQSILSPLNKIDYRNRTWLCVFCSSRSGLPSTGSDLVPNADSTDTFVTDYQLKPGSAVHSQGIIHLFVIDICVPTEDELAALKENLFQSITLLPSNARVGLISFGAVIELHEMSPMEAHSRSYAFRGSTEYSSANVREILGVNAIAERFLAPIADAEFLLSQCIDRLEGDVWPEIRSQRPIRCTGSALSLAAGLLDICYPKQPARILAFLSGVCSEGPGKAVGLSKEELIRGHMDIRRGSNAGKYWLDSTEFFSTLMQKMVLNSHVLDVCSACIDQTGIAEMRKCIECTGGYLLMVDTWRKSSFPQSLQNMLAHVESHAYNVSIEIKTSVDWKIMGAIGPFTGVFKNSSSISTTEMGLGKTCQWVSSRMDTETAIACYFELLDSTLEYRFLQVLVKYTDSTGDVRLRTVSVRHPTRKLSNHSTMGEHFDQEAAAVLVARHCSFLCESQPPDHVRRWLDTTLIKFVHRYADFTQRDAESLKLRPSLSYFPIFMYHLRRSPFLMTFNSSPDETANYRLQLYRCTVYHSILMIHPTLISYTINAPPKPIPLDEQYIEDRSILVLDTFFDVLVYYGPIIQSWRDAGFETKNSDFRAYCAMPLQKASAIIRRRQPCPQILECTKGDPACRVLFHKLNSTNPGLESGDVSSVATDDISLQTFTKHLKQKVVNF